MALVSILQEDRMLNVGALVSVWQRMECRDGALALVSVCLRDGMPSGEMALVSICLGDGVPR